MVEEASDTGEYLNPGISTGHFWKCKKVPNHIRAC